MLFRYPGGKSKQIKKLKPFFPSSYAEYREPFVGGGGVYWTIPTDVARWINDANRPLIAVYEALKSRPRQFIDQCDQIPPVTVDELRLANQMGCCYCPRLAQVFEQFKIDDTADLALRYLFLNRSAWNGRVIFDPARLSRTHFSNPAGWNANLRNVLADAASIVADTKITCSDYEWLFDEPGQDVFVLADPPYVKDTELSSSAKLYERGFAMEDHRRLRQCVERCRHKVMITYDDHPLVRTLYKDFFIYPESWVYFGRADRKIGRELIITNYPVERPVHGDSGVSERACDSPRMGVDFTDQLRAA